MNKLKRILAAILLVTLLVTCCFTVPAFAAKQKKANFTTTGNVYIRKGPGQNFSQLEKIPKGTTITATEYTTDARGMKWVYTTYKGTSGWVSSSYLKKTTKKPSKKVTTVVTAEFGKTYIRKAPNLDSKILTTLQKDKSATYLGKSSIDDRGVYWYKVSYNGKTGWVSERYVVVEEVTL